MNYFVYKDCARASHDLYKRGGKYQKASGEVQAILGRISNPELGVEPFQGVPRTKSGESRIPHCVKYDLQGFCRLVTIQNNGMCFLVFCGDHNECEVWLERNRNFVPTFDGNKILKITYRSADADPKPRVGGGSGHAAGPLYELLSEILFEKLVDGIARKVVRGLEDLDASCAEGDIWAVANEVEDISRRNVLHNVFSLLRQDRIGEAKERAALFFGESVVLTDLPAEALPEVIDSDVMRRLRPQEGTYAEALKRFIRTTRYRDWMLFMHPEQDAVVQEDFDGPAKLVGVSGSGKTCVVVQRAVRLARKYERERVLILTLNRALAHLIADLVDACTNEQERPRIEIMAFFELCQKLLKRFEPRAELLYDEQTWKTNEHVDEIWQEYYRCEVNNYDARVFQSVHDTLLTRGLNPERYLREEVDWIRSALSVDNRNDYLEMKRTGRTIPLTKPFREAILAGSAGWEDKMSAVGAIDSLGIAHALLRHADRLTPQYRCVLVDEAQDFGNIELGIARRLVASGENDLFFCGDAAQAVTTKFQSLRTLGIQTGHRSRRLSLNYRNSRDVLAAAYAVLERHMTDDLMDREDFEYLDPEYSSFSDATPLLLRADTLRDEIAFARAYAEERIADRADGKACLAICGFTLYELQKFGHQLGIPVLDGRSSIDSGRLFLSDLEQTKGFEFDAVLVLNCNAGVLPNDAAPKEEHFRDLARLYVAMTRAKTDLVLSWSGTPSRFLDGLESHLLAGAWSDYVQSPKSFGVPRGLEAHRQYGTHRKFWREMTGEQFLYSEHAPGLSPELIAKIRELVDGKGVRRDGVRLRWIAMGDSADDYSRLPQVRLLWGPETRKEFEDLIVRLSRLVPPMLRPVPKSSASNEKKAFVPPSSLGLSDLVKKEIENVGLSRDAVRSLRLANVRTIGDLVKQNEAFLTGSKNFRTHAMPEIVEYMLREGLSFEMRWRHSSSKGFEVLASGRRPRRGSVTPPDES